MDLLEECIASLSVLFNRMNNLSDKYDHMQVNSTISIEEVQIEKINIAGFDDL
jgi:hypothetical protein